MNESASMSITRDEIEQILNECIKELFDRDWALLKNDVSERAITHKLAEYLQCRIPELNVDCEYNRNTLLGAYAPKSITLLKGKTKNQGKLDMDTDDLLAISAYPDIIVHRRMTNDENLLVMEVKKRRSQVNHTHDYEKLKAFTESSERNSYHFKYGVFLLLDTGQEWERTTKPIQQWFVEGRKVSRQE